MMSKYILQWTVISMILLLLTAARRILRTNEEWREIEQNITISIGETNVTKRQLRVLTAEDHRVNKLPGLAASLNLVHYAGYLTVDSKNRGNLFYWLFEAPEKATELPLVIWLNGGPGCSSMDGLFLELGPFRLDGDKRDQIKLNPYSWHNMANLLFIDQPVGTGLSYTNNFAYASSDDTINLHFSKFLDEFFDLHNRYVYEQDGKRKTRSLYIVGESHAGHYISTISSYIIKRNANVGQGGLHISLDGIALGNPWLEPKYQYDASDFAHGMGLISAGQKYKLKEMEKQCQSMLSMGRNNQKICFALLDDIIDSSATQGSQKVLMYDSRKYVRSSSSFPPGHEAVETYLNRADVRLAIHTSESKQRYVECADPPFNALAHQDGLGVTGELVEILNSGLRVLIYSGQYDIICNHVSTEKVLDKLDWAGGDGWRAAGSGVWLMGSAPAGYIKTHKNLQFLLVLDCGHMVPMDQPKVALDMITRFVKNQPFSAGASKLGVSVNSGVACDVDNTPRGSANRQMLINKGHNNQQQMRQLTKQQQRSAAQGGATHGATMELHKDGKFSYEPRNSAAEVVVSIDESTDNAADLASTCAGSSAPTATVGSEAGLPYCSLTVLMTIAHSRPSLSSPWQSDISKFGAYQANLQLLIRQDVTNALTSAAPTPSDVSEVIVQVTCVPASTPATATGNDFAGSSSVNHFLSASITLQGTSDHVRQVFVLLAGQLKDATSVLKNGILTGHALPQLQILQSHKKRTVDARLRSFFQPHGGVSSHNLMDSLSWMWLKNREQSNSETTTTPTPTAIMVVMVALTIMMTLAVCYCIINSIKSQKAATTTLDQGRHHRGL